MRPAKGGGTMVSMSEERVTRDEVAAYLFAVLDMHDDLKAIRAVMEGDYGEDDEADA